MSEFKPKIHLENVEPEVKSYIYQSIMEFQPFVTPETVVKVIAKDPLKLLSQNDSNGVDLPEHKKLRQMYRIAISLTEDGTKVEEEALHDDIFEAIRLAKEKLIATLSQIQNEMISAQDRQDQINRSLAGGMVH